MHFPKSGVGQSSNIRRNANISCCKSEKGASGHCNKGIIAGTEHIVSDIELARESFAVMKETSSNQEHAEAI